MTEVRTDPPTEPEPGARIKPVVFYGSAAVTLVIAILCAGFGMLAAGGANDYWNAVAFDAEGRGTVFSSGAGLNPNGSPGLI